MRCVRAWTLSLLAFVWSSSGSLFGQTSFTSLQGTITDASGGAVVGATISLINTESKSERTTASDTQGEYHFPLLPPGTYKLRVTARGFAHHEQTGLQLLVNTPTSANVQLKVGGATETITVTGEVPALNFVDASLGNSFAETQVKQLPIDGRNVPELLSLQAGVAYTGNRPDMDKPDYKDQDTRSGAVNGARSDQSNITLDGVDVNDQVNGYAFTSVLPVTQDSVQEFRVTTTNYDADQGGGSGAQVALITKSGTNNFHGALYEYNRNTATSANDYFIKQAELASGDPNKPLKLIRNVFGAAVGGPIKKDRLFFFLNYEGTRRREQESDVRNIPTPTLCQGELRYQNVLGGITTLTPTDLANLDPLSQPGRNPLGTTPGIDPAILSLGRTSQPGYFDRTFCTGKYVTNDTSVGDGLNYSGFRFRAPVSLDNNVFIARVDYHLTTDGKHLLFWRGNLQSIFNPQAPFLPGLPPEQTVVDHSKGVAVGYTAVLSPSMANTFRWGFTRASTGFVGDTNQAWNTFYTLDQGIKYSHSFQVPVHNLGDDFSWTKGAHAIQLGANLGFARDPRSSLLHSYSLGKGATFWMAPVAFANTAAHPGNGLACLNDGSPLDPCNLTNSPSCNMQACPEPASTSAYDYPMLGLFGMVSLVTANYNYDRQGNLLASGQPVKRNWGLNWYEIYGQDSWHLKRNLTITYGVRWSLFPAPWEVNGLQATPVCSNDVASLNGTPACPTGSFDLGKYFNQNARNMQNGLGFADAPLISYGLGGPVNHAPGLYRFEKSDLAPRISIAYSPRPHEGFLKTLFGSGDKTVIRAGFSKIYDRAGMQLLNTFDANAPAGLAATVQNPCCALVDSSGNPYGTAAGVPRIADINTIPASGQWGGTFFEPSPYGQKSTFPQTPPPFGEAITWGIDQSIKTPYAYAIDFSVGRELPKGFSLQVSYVGRLGHNLLTQRDLMQPLDLVDPKTKIGYFQAATAISKLAASQGINATQLTPAQFDQALGPTAAYWSDLLFAAGTNKPGLAPGGGCFVLPVSAPLNSCTPDVAQAAYALYVTSGAFAGDEVVGLGNIDLFGLLVDQTPHSYYFNGKTGELLNQQLTTSYAWSSIGRSDYHALQATLRKQIGRGLQFDLNYTYSKSIDITSAAARLGYSGTDNIGAPGSRLVNAFAPRDVRAVSDFDTTHQINANWIADLPFGKGRAVARNASSALDAFIGGWQLSGLARWTTGFPFTVDNGQFWATDWDEQGSAQLIARPRTGVFRQPNGTISVFANPADALNDYIHPFPGGSGSRNVLRGDGFASWDMGLTKRWKIPHRESHSLQFRWEVFNVPNLKRFNVLAGLGDGAPSLQQVPDNFGDYTNLLTQPRVMQFALRYEF